MVPKSKEISAISKMMASLKPSSVGTINFVCSLNHLLKKQKPSGIIFQESWGEHVISVVLEKSHFLSFYHWSPGTGSRVARVDLNDNSSASTFQFLLSWHPRKIALAIAPRGVKGGHELIAEGEPTNKSFRLTRHGKIIQVGDEYTDILELRMEIDGKPVVIPTAKESWRATLKVCEILQHGQSNDSHMFEVIRNNSILTTLVTGFETYCKKRLIELEGEGVSPDLAKLAQMFRFETEAEDSLVKKSKTEAHKKRISVLDLWLFEQRRVNFQEFEQAKKAFNKAYGIKFGEIGVGGDSIDKLKTLFSHRHRIIHVSPLIKFLIDNNPKLGTELLLQAPAIFDEFIGKLHETTLVLGVTDKK